MNNGSYISIDFDTKKLKKFYGNTATPYNKIKKYLTGLGYTSLKDSNYQSDNLTENDAFKHISIFAEKNKWFALSINKINILPINDNWDLTATIKEFYSDKEYVNEKRNLSELLKDAQKRADTENNIKSDVLKKTEDIER